ncbi:helicase-exonuclease AddAB subunit AddA [Bacillus cytotoxicus]|uniref:helicase-exonuclease AddAB subunit AddA n=1 Tax=Bacillus cytotoxicus TaxID=580165 RepID=UPI00066134B3|nr:helicase-exonuclease AddAB subunit AddA [Bacillus cytotoxicus]AWC30782.1 helicase-exonuclease AddAB subunit AddA [Bacillus cytotoxicus]AWC34844.1 helicase-exonuclease AddAB subunit AddA [Bacillus cytotoxicus]AWC38840.1 helicase-exonuclease AddAB subunit AddA [Bacillus cytotoxicus]AWC42970.1 helicase-exonuclease AddAB subunit AddA [Bacillus cytotoxicus]AWC50901.1 helicase-exonuclease AddAB subunit AddA [Bacillus cytotoxicus]
MVENWPAKPEGSQWTDDQWKAVVAHGRDILVAAAAGSGKTAVLVERIIKKIINEENPVDVDRLLVVTFTNAAAQEMKNRIGEALEKVLIEEPSSRHIRKQLSLLNKASISTIHSFCLQVIRSYYYMLDIDPRFRIANQTENELLKEEVLDDILEEEYGMEENQLFFELVDRYTSDRNDDDLQRMILALHTAAGAHPNPEKWLDRLVEAYNVEGKTIEDLMYASYLLEDVKFQLETATEHIRKAMELAMLPDGPAPRMETLQADLVLLETLSHAARKSWTSVYEAMQHVSWQTLKRIKKSDYNEDIVKQVDSLRNKAKDEVKKLQEELFSRKPESFLRDFQEMHPVLGKLVQLVKEFSNRFQAIKRDKGMVDFTDLEHFCLQILSEQGEDGELRPSPVALQYRNRFAEVLVDEYQDTNFVQESIIKLVTKDSEQEGNLFMVGDVKQSIYRFRLAEPGLFLGKYKRFTQEGLEGGMKIDLAKNFRSRHEVLAGTNFIFKQIMGEEVGEIEYDADAELKLGASYPEGEDVAAELLCIHQSEEEVLDGEEGEEVEKAQLEARLIAQRIKAMVDSGYTVYDRKTNEMRQVQYRDFVILLRSMPWAPQIMEELKLQGIPVYAELATGYFEATEVNIMMNVFRVIDNPVQDIPLAAVLRSPIVGLNDEELAMLRAHAKKGSFYEVMRSFLRGAPLEGEKELHEKLKWFYHLLQGWREFARQQSLSDLIWKVYRETGYYDFVGGLPGGKQRQANLRVLYDRARQYEATSFRGLFRFLRFIERILERGDDMGTARALGEQEDVVRIMTIHKSKGLEFPVVFVAGLGRRFNTQDLMQRFLLHKDFGFGSQFIDPRKRIKYTTLSQLAIKRKMKRELIAEEMRVLYVALTRAKEKLILIGTVKDKEKEMEKWLDTREHTEWLLPDYVRASASCYLDWIAPSLYRHRDSEILLELGQGTIPNEIYEYDTSWKVEFVDGKTLLAPEPAQEEKQELLEALREKKAVPLESERKDEVYNRLTWKYEYEDATLQRAKQSVTEIKRNYQSEDGSDTAFIQKLRAPIRTRPRFMEKKGLTYAERGTAVHAVMQHVDLKQSITIESIQEQIAKMVNKEILTFEQAEEISVERIVAFFESHLGKRVLEAKSVEREVPFTMMLSAKEAYQNWQGKSEETILVQGVIDCMIEEDDGITLIDFKTDTIEGKFPGGFDQAKPILEERYKVQLSLYAKALEKTLQHPVKEKCLYFFDGNHVITIEE